MFIGPFQIFCLIIRLLSMKKRSEAYRKNLIRYTLAIPLFLAFYFFTLQWFEGQMQEMYMATIPYTMAIAYTYIVYKKYPK